MIITDDPYDGTAGAPGDSGRPHGAGADQVPALEQIGWQRLGKQKALEFVATEQFQKPRLLLGLHAFRHHNQAQCVRHIDDGGHQRQPLRAGGHIDGDFHIQGADCLQRRNAVLDVLRRQPKVCTPPHTARCWSCSAVGRYDLDRVRAAAQRIRTALKSFTLVSVGPVTTASPRLSKKP